MEPKLTPMHTQCWFDLDMDKYLPESLKGQYRYFDCLLCVCSNDLSKFINYVEQWLPKVTAIDVFVSYLYIPIEAKGQLDDDYLNRLILRNINTICEQLEMTLLGGSYKIETLQVKAIIKDYCNRRIHEIQGRNIGQKIANTIDELYSQVNIDEIVNVTKLTFLKHEGYFYRPEYYDLDTGIFVRKEAWLKGCYFCIDQYHIITRRKDVAERAINICKSIWNEYDREIASQYHVLSTLESKDQYFDLDTRRVNTGSTWIKKKFVYKDLRARIGTQNPDNLNRFNYYGSFLLKLFKTTGVIKKKEVIPVDLRDSVWMRYTTLFEHRCFCCHESFVPSYKFVCGHILSEKHGGTLTLDNLRPVCQKCNSTMGIMHMFEYMYLNRMKGLSQIDPNDCRLKMITAIYNDKRSQDKILFNPKKYSIYERYAFIKSCEKFVHKVL